MLTALYCCFAVLCGWLEAILYAKRGAEAFGFNEHIGMTLQRVAAALLVPATAWLYARLGWWVAVELVPAALLFPACHDEAYNFTRLWLSYAALPPLPGVLSGDWQAGRCAWHEYRYGYQSPTTTARNDFNGHQRTWLASGGLILLLAIYLRPLLWP